MNEASGGRGLRHRSRRSSGSVLDAAADDDVVVLTAEDLSRIDEILPDGSFGGRYPAGMMPSW